MAYGKAASISNAQSGYQKSEIYPLNRVVFGDWEFMPSKVTDRLATAAVTKDVHIAIDCNKSASISIQSQTPGQTQASSEDQITNGIENAFTSTLHDFQAAHSTTQNELSQIAGGPDQSADMIKNIGCMWKN